MTDGRHKAGTYDFPDDGRCWTGFDRNNPIELLRATDGWTAERPSFIASWASELTASALTMGLGLAACSPWSDSPSYGRPRAGVGHASLDQEGQGASIEEQVANPA